MCTLYFAYASEHNDIVLHYIHMYIQARVPKKKWRGGVGNITRLQNHFNCKLINIQFSSVTFITCYFPPLLSSLFLSSSGSLLFVAGRGRGGMLV